MRAHASVTRQSNPYQAGLELGDALRAIRPDLVFVFASGQYADTSALVEGVHDAIDHPGLVIIGNAGDGFYSQGDEGAAGASALGLAFDDGTTLHLASTTGASADTSGSLRRVFAALESDLAGRTPSLVFLQADARTNLVELETVVTNERRWPIAGGLVSDIHGLTKGVLFANRERIVDGVAALAIAGPTRCTIEVANRFEFLGDPATVDDANGTVVRTIAGERACDFVERTTGKPLLLPSSAIAVLSIVDDESDGARRTRGIVASYDDSIRALTLYGKIESGERVQVCRVDPDRLVDDVRDLAVSIRARGETPTAALIISCNGRKWCLRDRIGDEVRALVGGLGAVPFAGFPSFAELLPSHGHGTRGSIAVHNMTYVLILFGR